MNSTRPVNPLTRLKLSVVAASFVLGGSWAMLAQSPIASAHAGFTPTAFSGSPNTTQSAPWAKLSHQNECQAGRFKNTGKAKGERHYGPQSKNRFGHSENKKQEGRPFKNKYGSGKKERGGTPSCEQPVAGSNEGNNGTAAPFWTKYLTGKTGHGPATGPQGGPPQAGNAEHSGAQGSGQSHPGGPAGPQWGPPQAGNTGHTGPGQAPGQAPFWTKFLSGHGNDKSQGGEQCKGKLSHAGKKENKGSGDKSCKGKLSHAGNGENKGPGGAPFTGGNEGNNGTAAPFWTKYLSGKTQKNGTPSGKTV